VLQAITSLQGRRDQALSELDIRVTYTEGRNVMGMWITDEMMARERHKDLLRDLEHERLVHRALQGKSRRTRVLTRAWAWLGRIAEAWEMRRRIRTTARIELLRSKSASLAIDGTKR